MLSSFLFYWCIYCQYNHCGESVTSPEKNQHYAQASY
uniref:Uncharacterized protein n=1 Tax=Heterorhabditis bacteriophora TaxID=37862 RepID=A0A1I7W7B6_HETBA